MNSKIKTKINTPFRVRYCGGRLLITQHLQQKTPYLATPHVRGIMLYKICQLYMCVCVPLLRQITKIIHFIRNLIYEKHRAPSIWVGEVRSKKIHYMHFDDYNLDQF